MIIDECLTFNVAGTLTVAFATINTILFLNTEDPKYLKEIREEFKE